MPTPNTEGLIAYLATKGIEARRVQSATMTPEQYYYYNEQAPLTSDGVRPGQWITWPDGVYEQVEFYLAGFDPKQEPDEDAPKAPAEITSTAPPVLQPTKPAAKKPAAKATAK